jgi:hypothetical protein
MKSKKKQKNYWKDLDFFFFLGYRTMMYVHAPTFFIRQIVPPESKDIITVKVIHRYIEEEAANISGQPERFINECIPRTI